MTPEEAKRRLHLISQRDPDVEDAREVLACIHALAGVLGGEGALDRGVVRDLWAIVHSEVDASVQGALSHEDQARFASGRQAIAAAVGALLNGEPPAERRPTPSAPIQRGEIYWISLPRPGSIDRPHPHVVLQDDALNQSRIDTVVVCALTTNLHRATEPGNVLLEEGEGMLPARSVVVVSQVSTVSKHALGEPIGRLGAARVEQILDGLRLQQRSGFSR